MNTAVKTLSHTPRTRTASSKATPVSYRMLFGIILLAASVLISAFAIVYVSDLNRRLFIDYQNLQTTRNQLNVEWGRLLLEQSTWSSQARVQSIAQQRLGLVLPAAADITMIKQ